MQTLVINRQNGNISKTPAGRDHVSGLLFLVSTADAIPDEFADDHFAACSSTKTADDLGLTASDTYGYHVHEALRLNPGLTLWVGFAVRSEDFKGVSEIQRAASGEIRQLGILDTAKEISRATVAALQAQADALDEAWMPLSIIIAPKVTTLASLPDDIAASSPAVSVLIGRDLVASAPAIGTLIGILSARAVNESIAWVERCETGLTAPAFSDGTPYTDVDKAVLEKLDAARYIYLRTYPGLAGVFFSDSHNMDDELSDYNTIELQRTMDKAVRGTRTQLLPQLGRRDAPSRHPSAPPHRGGQSRRGDGESGRGERMDGQHRPRARCPRHVHRRVHHPCHTRGRDALRACRHRLRQTD